MMQSIRAHPVKAVLAAAVMAGCAAAPAADPADLVLRGGHVVTVDSTKPEAEAVAIRGSTIVAVGTDAEIASYIGPDTEVVDLGGRLVVPGFIEGHGHFPGLGRRC
jgi:predicted amidohydrolase YtcJ